jgi:hypothetical protein
MDKSTQEAHKTMKKNQTQAAIILSTLIALSPILAATTLAQSDLQVTFTTNPTITAPGATGYLTINLRAIGDSTNNIRITATSDGTTIIAKGDWSPSIGSINGGSTYTIPLQYTVATTATQGIYQINVDITYDGGYIQQTAMIQIDQPSFIDLTAVNPATVNIGQATTVNFNLTNTGSTIYHVLLTWKDPNNYILPIGSDNHYTIPVLPAGNTTSVPITLMASPSLSPGIYALNITLQFFDQAGTDQTVTSIVGLQVAGATSFEVVASQSTSSTSLTVINTGANTANSVIVTIPTQASYTVSGSGSANIGNLDPGDYSLASFQLTSTSTNGTMNFSGAGNRTWNRGNMTPPSGTGNYTGRTMPGGNGSFIFGGNGGDLTVVITYTDSFGVRQTVRKQVTLSSRSSGSFSGFSRSTTGSSQTGSSFNFGQQASSSGSGLIYIIIGVVGIILIGLIVFIGKKKGFSRLKRRKE